MRPRGIDESVWDAALRTTIARAQAVACALAPGIPFSRGTAAALHGMPLPTRLARDSEIHVSVARQEDRPKMRGVRAHLAPRDLAKAGKVSGLLVTDPVSTWISLASSLTVSELVGLGDHLVRRRDPDATINDLQDAVRRAARRHGVPRLREAIELIRPRTDSVRESEVRMILLSAGLPEPVVNHPILDSRGRLIRHGDMAYPGHRVLLEYDGEQHRLDDAQYRLDKEQLDRILAEGWKVIHVLKGHLASPSAIVARVRNALRSSPDVV